MSNSTNSTSVRDSVAKLFSLTYTDIVYIVAGSIGIIGNLLAIIVFVYHKPLRQTAHNWYIINQTLANLVTAVLLIATNLIKTPATNVVGCILWEIRLVFIGIILSSIYFIAFLSIERYWNIVHPISHRKYVTRKIIVASIAAVWMFGVLFKACILVPFAKFFNGKCKFTLSSDPVSSTVTGLTSFFVEFLVPLFITVLCYILMVRSLRRSIHPHDAGIQQNHISENVMSQAKKNIMFTLLIVVLCFITCSMYKQVYLALYYLGVIHLDLASYTFIVGQLLANANCCVYPYVYFCTHKQFGKGLQLMFTTTKQKVAKTATATPSPVNSIDNPRLTVSRSVNAKSARKSRFEPVSGNSQSGF